MDSDTILMVPEEVGMGILLVFKLIVAPVAFHTTWKYL